MPEQQPFDVSWGARTPATVKIGFLSMDNADFSITINGSTNIYTPIGVGTDGAGGANDSADTYPNAAYNYPLAISGLSADKKYPFSVTQGGNTITGEVQKAPATEKYAIGFLSCDNKKDTADNSGMYSYYRAYAQNPSNPDLVGLLHVDDHGYVNSHTTLQDQAYTGRFVANTVWLFPNAYSYIVGHCAYRGLLGNPNNSQFTKFWTEDRIWCRRNIGLYPQVGDHEFANNQCESPRSATIVTAGTIAWNATIGMVAPDYINSDNSLAWVHTIGSVQIITYDRCTNASGVSAAFNTLTQEASGEPVLGTAQISDILGAIDLTDATPFKLIGASSGSHFMMSKTDRLAALAETPAWNTAYLGASQPIDGYAIGEWKKFMTQDASLEPGTPSGILAKGIDYNFNTVMLHGDLHHGEECMHYRPPATSDEVWEMLMEISSGTVDGSGNHPVHPSIAGKYSYKGSTITWRPDNIRTDLNDPAIYDYSCIIVEVDPVAKEMVIKNIFQDETVMRENTLVHGKDNLPEWFLKGRPAI